MNLTCHKKTALLLLVLLLCLAAAGCGKSGDPAAIETAPAAEPLEIGGQSLSPDTTDLTAVLSAGETAQLDKLPNLHFADLSGSENVEEIAAWAKAHPDISVKYTVTLPDGTVLPSDTRSVDFSAASGSDALAAAPALSLLQNLKILKLGRERSDINAVIDLDGTMLGEYVGVENGEMLVRDDPYTVPVLDLNNWESYNNNEEYIARGFPYPNVEVVGHAADGFSVGIRDSRHMDFTDLPLLSPFLGKMLGSGERSTEETMTIVNSLVLSFFNCYLKGEGVFTAQELY